MEQIAESIPCSVRTVYKAVTVLRRSMGKTFHASRYWRSKKHRGIVNTKGEFIAWKTLKRLCIAFMLGFFDSIEVALGDDPP